MSMGSMIGTCNWWCRTGKNIRKGVKFANDLGILPPFVNVGAGILTSLMGANNSESTTTTTQNQSPLPQGAEQLNKLNGLKKHYRIGQIPTVF
jgi:hypothetical protein